MRYNISIAICKAGPKGVTGGRPLMLHVPNILGSQKNCSRLVTVSRLTSLKKVINLLVIICSRRAQSINKNRITEFLESHNAFILSSKNVRRAS